ncbi:MAG: hypothetical protein GKC10_02980 [Methanosarcinales archaeon]|nr:hypothetical protein [Methanosarcinales archaeon]
MTNRRFLSPWISAALLAILVMLCGCLDQQATEKFEKLPKYSERTEGTRSITVYKSADDTIRASVIVNNHPAGFSNRDLTNEIRRLVPNPDTKEWDTPLSPITIDGHTAVATRLVQVSSRTGTRTNNIPDLYATAIAYPEKGILMTITSNGAGVTPEVHQQLVETYRE